MDTALPSIPETPKPPSALSPPVPSYAMLRKRCRRLAITEDELQACPTLAALQSLAKHKYHRLARQYHPDAHRLRLQTSPKQRPLTGETFRLLTKTYDWFMALPPHALLPTIRKPLPTLWYETPPIYEADLPYALERKPLNLPPGWQEELRWYR